MKNLYKATGTEQYFLHLDGGLRSIPQAVFEEIWQKRPLGNVIEFTLAAPPLQVLDNSLPESAVLFRVNAELAVWLVDEIDGSPVKRHVVNESQLYAMFQDFENVVVESDSASVAKLPTGPTLSTDPVEFPIASLSGSTYFGYDVAELSSGGFVAVWSSMADGRGQSDVLMRRFDKRCLPLGAETKIDTATRALAQPGPSVSGLSDGGL